MQKSGFLISRFNFPLTYFYHYKATLKYNDLYFIWIHFPDGKNLFYLK